MSKNKMTNKEFVKNLMMVSRRGALIQVFVLTALQRYSEHVIAHDKSGELTQDALGPVNKVAWVDCAKEVLEKLEKEYELSK